MSALGDLIDATSGLLLHWPMDEPAGAVAADTSGAGLDGEYYAAPLLDQDGPGCEDIPDRSVYLDGSGTGTATAQYVHRATSPLSGNVAHTHELWFRPDADAWTRGDHPTANLIQQRATAEGSASLFRVLVDGPGESWGIYYGTPGFKDSWPLSDFIPECWHHLAVSRDAADGTISVYLNGVLRDTAGTSSNSLTAENLSVGGDHTDIDPFASVAEMELFKGRVAHFAIYDRALTAEEIADRWAITCGCGYVPPDPPDPEPTPARNLLPRNAGRGRLGCGLNEAYITWKCGTPRFCPVLDTTEITWNRMLDGISEATVVVTLPGNNDETCCACLGDVEPWCHELHIARDGVDVWLGPITEVVYEFNKVTIKALDLLGWATVRVPEILMNFTDGTGECTDNPQGEADWSTMAMQVLNTAFAEDDPCVLPYVSMSLTGYVGAQCFPPYVDTAFDQLDQLAGTGLDYTVVGRTVILASPNVPVAAIATLMDDHIIGEVELTKSGLLQGNRWFVHYENDEEDEPPGPGYREADEQHCYGLIERIRSSDTALANKDSAEIVAQIYVDATSIAPRLLEIPDGSQLSPEAPWTIDQMIPGVRVDVGITRLCVDATQSFRLAGMSVRQTPSGEEVTVNLDSLNVLSEGL